MMMKIQIDDKKHEYSTLSVLLLDEAIKMLINNGELSKEKLANAIVQAKDDLCKLNKANDDKSAVVSLVLTAQTLQCRYLAL